MHQTRWKASFGMLLAVLVAAPEGRAESPMDMCVSSYEQAQRLRKAGDLLGSKDQLLKCLVPRCPTVLRKDCNGWLREVEAATPSFFVEGRDPAGREAQLTVSLDGQPIMQSLDEPVPVNPGTHVFEVQSGTAQRSTYEVVARLGEQGRRLHVVLPPRVPREVWVLAGLGLAEAGVATYFAVRGHSTANDCSPSCTPGDAEAINVDNTAAGISLGMAALSLGAAGWLYWRRPRAQWTEPTPPPSPPRVGFVVLPTGSMVGLSGHF